LQFPYDIPSRLGLLGEAGPDQARPRPLIADPRPALPGVNHVHSL